MENGVNGTTGTQKPKWYLRKTSLVVGFLAVGPLALPLLWFNPRYSLIQKLFWTVIVIALTWALMVFMVQTGEKILDQYRQLGLIQ